MVQDSTTPHLPVLVLWLERHQGALFAARQDVLWRGAVNLLQLIALFLPPTTICSRIKKKKKKKLHVASVMYEHFT